MTSAEGGALHRDVLSPWLGTQGEGARQFLENFTRRQGKPIPDASLEDLYCLYALSRCNDLLLRGFQTPAKGETGPAGSASVTHDQDIAFMSGLGLRVVQADTFSPFHHELVTVEQAEDDASPILLQREYCPTLMLGDMLFSRAGVAVKGGRRRVRKAIAENSTLYWAYSRENRPTSDLSCGWGGTSQWRTCFRRDYCIGKYIFMNVDGNYDLANLHPEQANDLTSCERVEWLLHRCLVTSPKPHDDLFPFKDTLGIDASAIDQADETVTPRN
jgi:hypothetical protein